MRGGQALAGCEVHTGDLRPMLETTPSTYGHTPQKDQLIKRLHRNEGQVRGSSKMTDGDRYCIDILQQISAVKARSTRSRSASSRITYATA